MNQLKQRVMNLLTERKAMELPELARLTRTSESHVLQIIFRLQEDKYPVVIEKDCVYLDKGDDPWAFVAGVFCLTTLILVFML